MIREEDLASLGIKDEDTRQRLTAAVNEYVGDPSAKTKDLAKKYNFALRTLQRHFKDLGIIKEKEKERVSAAQKEVRKAELDALSTEAEKIVTIAIKIGGVVARRFLPLIDHLMTENRTLEMIGVDIMEWYEMKLATKVRISELETKNLELKNLVSKLRFLAKPGIQYTLRVKTVEDFMNKLIRLRMHGMRIRINPIIRALNKKLVEIEKDLLKMCLIPAMLEAILKKQLLPKEAIEEIIETITEKIEAMKPV